MKLIQAILLVPFTFFTLLISKAQAQSITSAPDGVGTIINHNGNSYNITGGTISGTNLFHSFTEFGLSPQEVANFLSNPQINNILGRVTGGNASVVEGLIKLTGGNSNLYLMNPSGWVFGQGASLDVPGSFAATTATRIGLGDGFFNAFGDNDFSKLAGSPTSFVFDSQTGLIINEGNLEVGQGESLWLIGNSVISTGTLEAPGGNVTIAAIPEKKQIRISQEGMILELVLDAAPLSTGNYGENIGLRAVDIPRYLSGGNETVHAKTVTVGADGKIYLTGGNSFSDGDVTIAGEVRGKDVTLMAANKVTPTNPDLIFTHDGKHSAPTVVLFPGEGDGLGYTFIDATVEDYETLLYGGVKGTVSFVVTPDEDGIAFVGDKLEALGEQNRTIETLTILTEGSGGNFWLGKAFVSHENLALYEAQLQRWQGGLGVNADLLLYSCFAALGINGEALVNGLATLTAADVAASTNLTGSSEWGADWDLEYEAGTIEAGVPFEGDVLDNYDHTLAVFTATNGDDSGAGSLRQAITDANNAAGDDEIRFATGLILVTLTTAQLDIDTTNGTLTIDGDFNGASNVVVERSTAGVTPEFRIFEITGNNDVTFDALTIRNGKVTDSGGGINNQGSGTLTLTNSTVSGNEASFGGGILSFGGVTLTNSTVSGNEAGGFGGGIFSFGGVNLTNSTVSGNEAGSFGGGIRSRGGAVTLTNSIVSGNDAEASGGGIYSSEAVTLTNSTVSGNEAGSFGGGIRSRGGVTLINSTISGNEARSGGGIFSSVSVTLTNSIVSGNDAEARGGGIRSRGGVNLTNSTVSGNEAQYVGGGILSDGGVNLTNSTVSGNEAGRDGGGIFSLGGVNLTNSTVSGNEAGRYDGGGILSDGGVNLTNSTVSGNEAGRDGGGIFSLGGVNLTNSTVSGNEAGRYDGGIFSSVSVTLTNSTVSGNEAQINGGGILSFGGVTLTNSTVSGNEAGGFGGGIFSFGGVNLTNSTVSGNEAGSFGGGILSRGGAVTLTNSTVSGNEAGTFGSGIYISGGAVTLTNSTVSGNEAGTFGSGIYISGGAVTLTNSTVSGNEAGTFGSGIYISGGAVTLTNSTVSGNEAGTFGSGIYINGGAVTLTNSTVSGNEAGTFGSGIYISGTQNNTINNSIIANNQSAIAPDISGDFSTSTIEFSLIENTTGITGKTLTDGVDGNILGKDPQLLALGDYGGPTQTHALHPDSPALNKGSDTLAVDQSMTALTTDQRGASRFNGTVDMGAFETQGYTLTLNSGNNQSTIVNTAFPTNLAVQITEDFANSPLPGITVTFTPTPGTRGASGSFAGGTAITDASGIATANILTANDVFGGFTVNATVPSISSGTFNLTNNPANTTNIEVTKLKNLGESQGICEIPEVTITYETIEEEEEKETPPDNTCQSPSGKKFSYPNHPGLGGR